MFTGMYNHQLDNKSRLRLPAKFRSELGGSFFCLKGFDNTVLIYSKTKFEKFCEQYEDIPMSDIAAQQALGEIISTSFEIVEDSQGRFVLPNYLKSYANIEKNVVVKGVGSRIEIWSEKAHEERTTDLSFNELVVKLKKGDA